VDVTVAICTWNRVSLLERTLERLLELKIPADVRWQLWVVDNNSTDATPDLLRSVQHKFPLRILHEPQAGLSFARNRVLREVTADLLAWTDDDVLVDTGWLTALVNASREFPNGSVFGGPIEPWFLEPPAPELIEAFPSLAVGYCGLPDEIPAGPVGAEIPVWGANMAFRRAAIDGLLFNTHLGPSPTFVAGGDEVDFMRQVRQRGGAVVWCPGMRIKHCVPPERATLPYLEKYTRAKGCEHVLLANRDTHRSGAEVAVPNWLWRAYATALVREWAGRVGPAQLSGRLWSGPAPASNSSRRVRQLVGVRERCFLGGMIEGFRKQPRSHAVTMDARPAVHSSVGQRP